MLKIISFNYSLLLPTLPPMNFKIFKTAKAAIDYLTTKVKLITLTIMQLFIITFDQIIIGELSSTVISST